MTEKTRCIDAYVVDGREGKCQVKFGTGKGETLVDGQYISPEAIRYVPTSCLLCDL